MLSDVIVHFLQSNQSRLAVEELKDWVSHYEIRNSLFLYDPRFFTLSRMAIGYVEQGNQRDGTRILRNIVAVLDDPSDTGVSQEILFTTHRL